MNVTMESVTRQEQKQPVLDYVQAFIDDTPATMPDENNPFRNAIEALALNEGTPKEQRQRTLENIRRMPQHKAFDALLKREYDSLSEEKSQSEDKSREEWTPHFVPLPDDILPKDTLAETGVVAI